MEEIWVDIKDYEGLYQVSNQGRVRSLDREVIRADGKKKTFKGKILKLIKNKKNGYLYVSIKGKTYLVHRLVAEAFIPNPENKPDIDHINTVRDNNKAENLRWVTKSENMNNELTKEKCIGENNHRYGKKHTEEFKRKLSDMLKGENSPNYGKHPSKETRIKMSESQERKRVVQLTLDNKLVKIWEYTRESEKRRI